MLLFSKDSKSSLNKLLDFVSDYEFSRQLVDVQMPLARKGIISAVTGFVEGSFSVVYRGRTCTFELQENYNSNARASFTNNNNNGKSGRMES